MRGYRCWFGCVLLAGWLASLSGAGGSLFAVTQAQAKEPKGTTGDAPVSFLRDVAPILQNYCQACHDTKKRLGKYDMSTWEALTTGGNSGEPIIPGKPEESELYTLMVTQEERRMPPRKDGLAAVPAKEAEIIRRWIAQGAKKEETLSTTADLRREVRRLWQPPMPAPRLSQPAPVTALAFNETGDTLWVAGTHEIAAWHIPGQRWLYRLPTRMERLYQLAVITLKNGDRRLLAAGGRPGQEGELIAIEIPKVETKGEPKRETPPILSSLKIQRLAEADDSLLTFAFDTVEQKLYAGGCDRLIRVVELAEGWAKAKETTPVDTHADWVLGMDLVRPKNGKQSLLLTASRDKTVKIWDCASAENLMTFPNHEATVQKVVSVAEGTQAISVGADGKVRLFAAKAEGKQVRQLGEHKGEITALAADPGRTRVISAGSDGRIQVWMPENPKQSRSWPWPGDVVLALAVDPAGKTVAIGDFAGQIQLRDIETGEPVRILTATFQP